MNTNNNKKINNLNLAMIYGIVSICVVMFIAIFWCTQKNGMFLDEIYSYGLSNSYYEPFLKSIKQDNIIDTTFSKQEFIDYLTVSKKDAFSYDSVIYNQSKDVHPPLFYVLLHTVSSIFLNSYSKWLGLGLNLIYYLIMIIFIYNISKQIFKNIYIPGTMVLLYGCSLLTVSNVLFIRMYVLSTMLTVILAYLVLRVLKKDNWRYYVLMCIVTCLGLLTHYFFVFYAFFISVFLVISLFIKKNYTKAIKSGVFLILGVILFIVIFPTCLQHVTTKTGTGISTVEYLLSFDLNRLYTVTRNFALVYKIPVIIGAILLLILLINFKKMILVIKSIDSSLSELIMLVCPAILSFFVIILVSNDYRYLSNISPFFIFIIGYLIEIFFVFKKNKYLKITSIIIIIASSMFYALSVKSVYLYSDYKEYDQMISECSNYSCVYITNNRNPSITQDMPQLLHFDNVIVVEDVDGYYFDDNIKTIQENDGVVVYFASYPEQLYDADKLTKIMKKTDFLSSEFMYSNGWSVAYKLTK